MSIFGGGHAQESCIQQIASGGNLGSNWRCLSSSESTLEGLEYHIDGSSDYIEYSNIVLQIIETTLIKPQSNRARKKLYVYVITRKFFPCWF